MRSKNKNIPCAEDWLNFLNACGELGPVSLYNDCQTTFLTAVAPLPSLESHPSGTCASDEPGNLMIDFEQWKQIEICTNSQPAGIDVRNREGKKCFGAQLINNFQRTKFLEIAEAQPLASTAVQSKEATGLAPWNQVFDRRARELEATGTSPIVPVLDELQVLFEATLAAQLPLAVATVNDAAYFRVTTSFTTIVTTSSSLKLKSQTSVLAIDWSDLKSAWILEGHCTCCDEVRWSIEFYNTRNQLRLVIQAAQDEDESLWRNLLTDSVIPKP